MPWWAIVLLILVVLAVVAGIAGAAFWLVSGKAAYTPVA
jgi:hypothetical protein